MEKEKVTDLDFQTAFMALSDFDVKPTTEGRMTKQTVDCRETFKRSSLGARSDLLLEDFYDMQDRNDLERASDDRAKDIAMAKLAKIEKIVDLDADSPEDLEPSYAGKTIVQCPQCMTLFYKDPADVHASEEDPSVCNIGERCQHCGNEDGYTLIGKVAPAESPVEEPKEELPAEETAEELPEAPEEELNAASEGQEDDLENLDLSDEPEDEEPQEEADESFKASGETVLTEDAHKDIKDALDSHNDFIESVQKMIDELEKKLGSESNEEVKAVLQAQIDVLKSELEAALPDAVKERLSGDDLPTPEEIASDDSDADLSEEEPAESATQDPIDDVKEESLQEGVSENELAESSEEVNLVKEIASEPEISDEDVEKYLDEIDSFGESVEVDAKKKETAPLEEGIFDKIRDKAKNFAQRTGTKGKDGADATLNSHYKSYVVRVSPMNAKDSSVIAKDVDGKEIADQSFGTYAEAEKYAKEVSSDYGRFKKQTSDYKAYIRPAVDENVKEFNACAKVQFLFKNGVITDKSRENLAKLVSNVQKQKTVSSTDATNGEEDLHDDNSENKNATPNAQADPKASEEPKSEEQKEDPKPEASGEAPKEEPKPESREQSEEPAPAPEPTPKPMADKKQPELINAENGVLDVKKGDIAQGQDGKLRVITADDSNYKTVANGKAIRNATKSAKVIMKRLGVLESLENVDDIDEKSIDECITDSLKDVYENVRSFECDSCTLDEDADKLVVEGKINFKSGKSKSTKYVFESVRHRADKLIFFGLNESFEQGSRMRLVGRVNESRKLIAERFKYKYKIGEELVEGYSVRKSRD